MALSLQMFQFAGYTLDVARSCLRGADREIDLRPKAFEVLHYLLERADRLVTKEELIKAILAERDCDRPVANALYK